MFIPSAHVPVTQFRRFTNYHTDPHNHNGDFKPTPYGQGKHEYVYGGGREVASKGSSGVERRQDGTETPYILDDYDLDTPRTFTAKEFEDHFTLSVSREGGNEQKEFDIEKKFMSEKLLVEASRVSKELDAEGERHTPGFPHFGRGYIPNDFSFGHIRYDRPAGKLLKA